MEEKNLPKVPEEVLWNTIGSAVHLGK